MVARGDREGEERCAHSSGCVLPNRLATELPEASKKTKMKQTSTASVAAAAVDASVGPAVNAMVNAAVVPIVGVTVEAEPEEKTEQS